MKTDEIRESYLSFFETKGCVRQSSDVLVPRWDPSVLFTPAGMNQFKDHFLGRCKLEFTRATTCQKCLRTGDIDNVGRTAYHHTFFEMLGNFSFGDYFKRDAIHWAWEYLTSKKWLGIDPNRFSVSVYQDDEEAYEIWQGDIKLPTSRIIRMGEKDNFWPASAPSQGPDGVCGPCSEIFYHPDSGGEVEIWNLVFTQFNRVGKPPENLHPLPSKNIDTGMGLERMAAVMQGVDTNYHIDSLRPLVEAAAEICGTHYEPESDDGRRLRRIADHVRACTFAVHENVYPGPNKEKYVVKRLLRRAVLDGRQLGSREPFLHKLVAAVADLMKKPYPELQETTERVARVIEQEEENFFNTIDAGLDRIHGTFEQMRKENRLMVTGADAAEMYTTHGFPPELFEALAAEHNLTFDWDGFQKEMERHGLESGAGQRMELFSSSPLDALKKAMHGSEFLGYDSTKAEGKIVGIIAENQLCDGMDEVCHDKPIAVVLDQTPFYGESGGQVGDTGELTADGVRFEVTDTQKEGDFILHLGHLRQGKLTLGATVQAAVNENRRAGIRRAHSATHVLHYALQKHLGQHAQQQGSKVDEDWLRFDFTHTSAVKPEELVAIETEANSMVLAGEPVRWEYLPIAEARAKGAMMLFGEKYPDTVRMVSMGDFSKELCAGTHVTNTGQLGLIKIISEESVSSGTRRITAITGKVLLEHVRRNDALLSQTASALKSPVAQLPQRVISLAGRVRELEKEISTGRNATSISADDLLADASKIDDVTVIVKEVPQGQPEGMRQLIDQLRKKVAPAAILLASCQGNDKVTLIAGISNDLTKKGGDAGAWVREVAKIVGGRGGGRRDMAQAGGKNPEKLPEAIGKATQIINSMLAK